ncbi:MAG: PAS domain S-box protein [Bacteroidota bacterium]
MKNTRKKSEAEILRQRAEELLRKKAESKILELIEELAFQNEEKAKRADELIIANKELAFQNEEKTKRADELLIANKELAFQNEEKAKGAGELSAAIAYSAKLTHELQVYQVELETQNDELKRANEQIAKAANDKYAELYDFSPSGYFTLSKEGKILELNLCGGAMLGGERAYLKNLQFDFFVSDDTKTDFNLFLSRIFSGKAKETCEVTISLNGKLPICILLAGISAGPDNRCLVTAVDITQRKLTEDSLRKSEELLKTVVSNSSDLTTLTDINGILLFVSPQCETVLGYPVDKFIGLQIPDIIHPDDVEMVRLAWNGVYHEENELREFEYRIVDEHGAIRWVSHSAKRYFINEKAIGVASTIRLITDRKMAEQAIKVIDEKYKTMLNASPDAMLLIDLKGIIIEVSEIGLTLFGVDTRDDLLGKDIFQFVPPEANEIFGELLVKTVNEGFTQYTGLKVKKKNQSLFSGEISSTLMQDQNGAPISFMIIVRDISQRMRMEAKQIHSDRMSILGEMAAGIAHEIGQPLNTISLVMDKILFETSRAEKVDVEFLKIKSNKIFENIIRIRDIIDHIRAFSRSQDDYIHTAFNVNSSIVNASSMILEQFKHHAISLNLQLEPQIPPIVGNTYKFEQVILNLLANAKDAVIEKISRQQDVEMLIGIRSWHENQRILVEVTDNGIGINKDDLQNIMLPFYTTKEEGKGTGLGLSICYQIIKDMKGTIEISSDSSSGTKIKLIMRES